MIKTFLGIDPGSVCTGWAILRYYHRLGELLDIGVLNSGSITVPKNAPKARRLSLIQSRVQELLTDHIDIDEVFMEDTFVRMNARTAIALAQVQGVIMSSCWGVLGTEPLVIPVALIRKILHINPQAPKEGIKKTLCDRYKFSFPNEKAGHHDQSDAAAVALAGFIGKRGFIMDNGGVITKWNDPNKRMRMLYDPEEVSGLYPGMQFSVVESVQTQKVKESS